MTFNVEKLVDQLLMDEPTAIKLWQIETDRELPDDLRQRLHEVGEIMSTVDSETDSEKLRPLIERLGRLLPEDPEAFILSSRRNMAHLQERMEMAVLLVNGYQLKEPPGSLSEALQELREFVEHGNKFCDWAVATLPHKMHHIYADRQGDPHAPPHPAYDMGGMDF